MLDEQCSGAGPKVKHFCLTTKSQMFDQPCLTVWPKDKTLLLKHLKFTVQEMFESLVTLQNIAWQAEFACIKQKMFGK